MDYGNDKEWQEWIEDWNLHLIMQSKQRRSEGIAPTQGVVAPANVYYTSGNRADDMRQLVAGQPFEWAQQQYAAQSNISPVYPTADWNRQGRLDQIIHGRVSDVLSFMLIVILTKKKITGILKLT